jgi:hypothetical protein
VDDSERIIVNGREVQDVPTWSYDIPLGKYLRRGRNSVVAIIGDWSQEATLQGAQFQAETAKGKRADAAMRK